METPAFLPSLSFIVLGTGGFTSSLRFDSTFLVEASRSVILDGVRGRLVLLLSFFFFFFFPL